MRACVLASLTLCVAGRFLAVQSVVARGDNRAPPQAVDQSGTARLSYVLVYTFNEFNSQIVLEAPHEVFVFK